MRIENYNTFAQSQLVSNTKKTGNAKLPDYTGFQFNTKTAPAMSEGKYQKAIIDQAKKDQAAGKFQSDSAGFRSLEKSYVSVVSPDRKSIISNGLTAIYKNNKTQPEPLNLIDYLFGTAKYHKEAKSLTYAEFYDDNGEMVATYSNNGWTSFSTKAENARQVELCSIYNVAWNAAAKAKNAGSSAANPTSATSSIQLSV
ncbi:hypothetical protein [Anaerosinus massiliensis]|uniref:hypothetical protein n=1 Tax=Massilibacillus massiliensis TaxID=1806837 RepID=UPI0018FEDF44|nr:hypothetical protein [Massilibacillus massiliensis]